MTWTTIRAHYAALLNDAKLKDPTITQHAIAVRGGLSGQNAISKLLGNTKRGPSVETFIRAVRGLGIPLSTFFAALEAEGEIGTTSERPIAERLRDIEAALAALQTTPATLLSSAPATSTPMHGPGNVVHINIGGHHFGRGAKDVGSMDVPIRTDVEKCAK